MDREKISQATNELTSAAQVGISNYLITARGANLMGASARVARGQGVVRVFVGPGEFFEVTIQHVALQKR